MNSETQTESPTIGARMPARLALVLVMVAGSVVVADINGWSFDAPTAVLILGWMALIWSGWYMWRAGQNIVHVGTQHGGFDRGSHVDELGREKRRLLKAIKEIEFDHEMGKTSNKDAQLLVRYYRARAIDIIRELDARKGDGGMQSVDDRIDRDVKARRAVDKSTRRRGGKNNGGNP